MQTTPRNVRYRSLNPILFMIGVSGHLRRWDQRPPGSGSTYVGPSRCSVAGNVGPEGKSYSAYKPVQVSPYVAPLICSLNLQEFPAHVESFKLSLGGGGPTLAIETRLRSSPPDYIECLGTCSSHRPLDVHARVATPQTARCYSSQRALFAVVCSVFVCVCRFNCRRHCSGDN